MLPYLYLAVAVIVIIGIGVVGIMLIRRGRRIAEEDMFAAAPEDVPAKAGRPEEARPASSAWAESASTSWVVPESETAADASPASASSPPAPAPEPDYLEGVEHLLAEWRGKHELAASNAACEEAVHAEERKRVQAALAGAPCPPPAGLAAVEPPTATGVESPAGPEGPAREEPGSAPTVAAHSLWSSDPAAAQARALADPLGMVMLDMIDGKGRLAGAELKRLEVFRPERIDLAVQTFQLPPRLQGDEDVALRLAQIQLYAATLGLRAKWAAQMSRRAPGVDDTPYSARDFRLKIARDIMDLPTPDRSEVIGFLLGGLLSTPGSTPALKRAVIDTLEHLRSASLVNVLLDCLDDPDPIVQDYALAAADRLLDGQAAERLGG